MENLNTGQAVLESLNAPGFRGIAQGMLKYRDHQSSWSEHYLDFRNRKSVFLCYYQTTTRSFFHSAQNARDFIRPYYWVWGRVDVNACLRGYEKILRLIRRSECDSRSQFFILQFVRSFWARMRAALWKTHYFSLPVSFKQHNDYKLL